MPGLRTLILVWVVFFFALTDCAGKTVQLVVNPIANKTAKSAAQETAYFAEGCFWKTQHLFSKVHGIVKTRVGYMGGHTKNPTYKQVCAHDTGHAETVKIVYNPEQVSYDELLQVFFGSHDPSSVNRQGPDVGTQYRSAIFYTTPGQQKAAMAYKTRLDAAHSLPAPVATEIAPAGAFYDAEEYHQDYYSKHGAVCY